MSRRRPGLGGQGVAGGEVFWSANSGSWSSAPLTHRGGGRYVGTIPGLPAGTVVQFYVRAADTLGAAATFPAKVDAPTGIWDARVTS